MNHYETMGLQKKATEKEIKEAYKKLTKKFHPDLAASIVDENYPGLAARSGLLFNDELETQRRKLEAIFEKIIKASSVLSDPIKRKEYDQYGEIKSLPTIRAASVENFTMLFTNTIKTMPDSTTFDLISHMHSSVSDQKSILNHQITTAVNSYKKINKIKKRLSGPVDGLHVGILGNELSALRLSIKMAKFNIKVMDAVEKIIEEYSYHVDEPDVKTETMSWGYQPGFYPGYLRAKE